MTLGDTEVTAGTLLEESSQKSARGAHEEARLQRTDHFLIRPSVEVGLGAHEMLKTGTTKIRIPSVSAFQLSAHSLSSLPVIDAWRSRRVAVCVSLGCLLRLFSPKSLTI